MVAADAAARLVDQGLQMPKQNLVFVVDDDPGMLAAIQRMLRLHGYDSRVFPSVEAFENHDDFEEAHCIILDIDLNGASGIDLRWRLREAGVSVPVIYITGNDRPNIRAAAEQSGCLAYLTKPFSAKSLVRTLQKAKAADE
jgi:FixJ family two-component response regulator